jgi:molybdopterin molybdotransferase
MQEPRIFPSNELDEGDHQLISVDDALAQILSVISPLPTVQLPILEAQGMVLAEEIVAAHPLPSFDNSAMDGYALRSQDIRTASGEAAVSLRIVERIAAGHQPRQRLGPGETARIMTGAPMPHGADAVVRFEDVTLFSDDGDSHEAIVVDRPVPTGMNIRRTGEDVLAGAIPLRQGTVLRPQEIGLLAALGVDWVAVHRRPVVAIMSTGDELTELTSGRRAGQVRDSNSYTIAAMTTTAGGTPLRLGIARDNLPDTSRLLAECQDADLIVTSGGVSHGDFDIVKDILAAEGEIKLWQVRMKPGKPLAFGKIGGTPLLGLPGNPVAAAIAFLVFGRPAVRKFLGHRHFEPPPIQATLREPVESSGARRHFVRAVIEVDDKGEWRARAAEKQGAGVLSSMTSTNGLLVIPEHVDRAEAGMRFPVILFDESPPIAASAP